jgi:putative sigma-54 modulation protein
MNDFPTKEDRAVPPRRDGREHRFIPRWLRPRESHFFRVLPSADPILQPKRNVMNHQNPHELIVSGIHLELTQSLKTFVREKTDRLFRHEERIVRLRVELECDAKAGVGQRFKAKGHIVILGPDMNALVEADECHKAVSLLVDKLDRMLRRRSRLKRVKRHHPHAVELDAAIPKAI